MASRRIDQVAVMYKIGYTGSSSMTSWNILVTAPNLLPVLDLYRPLFTAQAAEVGVPPRMQERFSASELLALVGDVDGIICGDDEYTEEVLSAAPRLKVISKWGTGIDSIDQAACARRGIAVRNVTNAFSHPVADTVLAFMLAFTRQIVPVTLEMQQGIWQKRRNYALNEQSLGIIGLGNIGRAVAERAHAFGMSILGYDPGGLDEAISQQWGIKMTSLSLLLQESDYVSINCSLNPTSFHLIDAAALALMKPTAILINTARGPIVDEPALVTALTEKRLAGAGLDVFVDEPLPLTSELRSMPNVFLSPHNSNSSPKAYDRVHQAAIENVFAVLAAAPQPA